MKNRLLKNENGAILLLSLLLLIFLSTLLGAAMLRSNVAVNEVIQKQRLQEAFYAAETALDTAIFHLRQSGAWKPGVADNPAIIDEPFTISDQAETKVIGFYSVTVEDADPVNGWETRWVTATGKDSDKNITRTIRARVIVESPTKFLISTIGSLHIKSGSTFQDAILARDLFLDVNPSLPSPDNEIHLNGDVFYISSITGDQNPAVKFGNASKGASKAPAVTFAGVDLNRYQTLALNLQQTNLGYYTDKDLNINLDNLKALAPGSHGNFNPQIIYAKGDINISGTYDNSILIVAGGNIYINGDIVPNSSSATLPQIGLFAKGDVLISEKVNTDLTLEAFILADGGILGSAGTFKAKGDKNSKGTLTFKGSISVRGKGDTAVDLNVFQNRVYSFDPALSLNRTIPFTPFIVNVIQWQEI